MMDYKKKLEMLLPNSPYLKLEVMSSASLPKGQIISINTLGLFGNFLSEREKESPGTGQDGFTYFGSMAHVQEGGVDGNPVHQAYR